MTEGVPTAGRKLHAVVLNIGGAALIFLGLLLLAPLETATTLFEAGFRILLAALPVAGGVALIRVGSRFDPVPAPAVGPTAQQRQIDERSPGERIGKAIVVVAGWLLAFVALLLPSCVAMLGAVATFGAHSGGETAGAAIQALWGLMVMAILVAMAYGAYLMVASRQERLGRVPTDRTRCPYCSARLAYYGALCPACKRVLPQSRDESPAGQSGTDAS